MEARADPAVLRRAAIVTCGLTGLVVLASTVGLLAWADALDRAEFDQAWEPLTLGDNLSLSGPWAVRVSVWCTLCWLVIVSTPQERRRRVVLGAAATVGGWTALAAPMALGLSDGARWWLPGWPGPVAPTRAVRLAPGIDPALLGPAPLGPGVLMPTVLLAAVVGVCTIAARQPVIPPRSHVSPSGARLAVLALGLPAVDIWAVTLLPQAGVEDGSTLVERITWAVADPGIPLLVTMVTAASVVGRIRGGALVAAAVALPVVGAPAVSWFGGGSDTLLATAALGTVAVAVAAAVGPAAMALTRLDTGRADEVPPRSVPDGADADDRARA